MYFLTILMLCYYPLCKEGILCFLNTVCKELILYDGAKLKRIFNPSNNLIASSCAISPNSLTR